MFYIWNRFFLEDKGDYRRFVRILFMFRIEGWKMISLVEELVVEVFNGGYGIGVWRGIRIEIRSFLNV